MRTFLTCVFLVVAVFLGGVRLGNGENDYASGYRNYNSRPYRYSYAVSSPQTGDHKSQWEARENGVVRGSYSLLQPDGTTRVVDYTADHTGFHPTVRVLGNPTYDNPQSSRRYDYYDSNNYYKPQYYPNYDRRLYSSSSLSQYDGGYQNNWYYGRGQQQQQRQPLLSSAYHGYDNLYH